MIKTRVPNGDVESISVKISKAFGISNLAEAIDKHELLDESALPMEEEMLDLTEGKETSWLGTFDVVSNISRSKQRTFHV